MSIGTQLPFTFGVEFEFVFAILKSNLEDAGNRRKYPRRLHQAWLGPALVQILTARGLQVLVNGSVFVEDYSQWILDYELGCRIKAGQLSQFFPDDARLKAASEDFWHHEGLELISRVMRIPELVERGADNGPPLIEIRKYLAALVADRNAGWFVRTTEKCGLHIHIGVPDGDESLSQIPLNVLQHLAYILLEYEDVISCLHHPKRRGFYGSENPFIGTNKLGINRHHHVCNQYTVATDIIRDKIFAEDMGEEHLAELMGTQLNDEGFDEEKRYKFVNWEHIRRFNSEEGSERAPTVEFRQHRGSLDFNDVSQWIRFITALMRVAERRAQEATPPNSPSFPPIPRNQLTFPVREGRKYRFRCSRFQNRMEELFDLLGLDRIQKQYWISRLREYNAHEFIKQPYTKLCISCKALNQLTDPEQYLRFCKSLETIDASINMERRLSGREEADWTEEDARERDERIATASGDMMDVDDLLKSDLSSPAAIRTPRSGSYRTGPYNRVVDPKGRTRAGKSRSPGKSSDGIFFELKDVPNAGRKGSSR